LRQRGNQLIRAQLGSAVTPISNTKEYRPTRALRHGFILCPQHAIGVLRVLIQGVKVDAPHRIIHVEFVLESKRNILGIAHQQEVKRNLAWISRPRRLLTWLTRQPITGKVSLAIALRANVLPESVPSLSPTQRHQRFECLYHLWGGVACENHAPAGLLDLLWIPVEPQPESGGSSLVALTQIVVMCLVMCFSTGAIGDVGHCHIG
jgi:hypothetical protein